MKKKILIFIVAETGAGKNTVANKLPWPKIPSYTTRKKRNIDIDGKDHLFISDDYMDDLEQQDNIIAWTKTGDVRYCATYDQLKEDITIYIINPEGVRWFNKYYKGPELKFITIGLYLPLEVRKSRCRIRDDFETSFMPRVEAEQQDYDDFRLNGEFDYMIYNKDSNMTANIIYSIVCKEIEYSTYPRPVFDGRDING